MIIIKNIKSKVNEDDIQNGNGGSNASQEVQQQTQANQKSVQINNQIVDLMNKKLARKTQYQQDVRNLENQLVQLAKQKADLGEDVDINMIESVRLSYKFWRKLYEAVGGNNRTDEMYMIIQMSFSEIEDLSYMPNDTWCRTMAKRVIEFLNRSYKDPESLEVFVETYINASQISFSMRERDAFIQNFEKNISTSPMFSYTMEEK